MIADAEGWHYIAAQLLTALLRGIASKHHGDFYCLKFTRSLATDNKHEFHKKVSENKGFCNNVIISDDTEKLKSN